jgi:hypothetical protein
MAKKLLERLACEIVYASSPFTKQYSGICKRGQKTFEDFAK